MAEKRPGANAVIFILVTVLLDTIGFGIIIPVMPDLIMSLTGKDLGAAAPMNGLLMALYALTQFVCAPIFGNLSDRYGRRPVLLLSLLAFSLDYLMMGLAPTFAWLFVGRALAGVFGATFGPANAYIADISPPEKRAANFGLIGAAWGVGFMLGPAFGGLLGEIGPRVPFFAAAAIALINVIYGYFVLPESLAMEKRRPFKLSRANPLGALIQIKQYPVVFGLFGVVLLYQIAHDVNPTVWTFFVKERFDWRSYEIGLSLTFVGVMSIIVQAGLIRAVIPRIGEAATAYVGLILFAIGFLGIAFVTEGWMVYVCIVPFSLGGLAMPAIRGIMSNRIPDNAQGELQAALTCLMSLTAIGTPIAMPGLFAFYTGDSAPIYFPGAPFLVAAILIAISILLFAAVHGPAVVESE